MSWSAVSLAFLLTVGAAGAQVPDFYFTGQAKQQPINGDPLYRQVLPSIATLVVDGRVTGAAALIDASGLYVASRSSVFGNEVEARFFNGQTGHLRVVSQDAVTQLVLLRSNYVPTGAKPVSLGPVDYAPGTPLLIVMTDGTIRARLESNDMYGVIRPSNRALPLSEIRLETATEPIGGALIFTQRGDFVGMLNAALVRRGPAVQILADSISVGPSFSGTNAPAAGGFGGGGAGGGNETFGAGRNQFPSLRSREMSLGPAQLTVAYTPGLDVMRRVMDGFNSPTHEVQHPTIGVFCRDGAGGALVQIVQDDSPAAKAGIRRTDMIIGIGNYKVSNAITFGKVMFRQKPGDKIVVRIDRGGRLMLREVVVGKSVD